MKRNQILKIFACLIGICVRLTAQTNLPDNMVEAECVAEPLEQQWGIVQGNSSPLLSHMYAQPFIGDIDNDGLTDLVTVGYNDAPWRSSSIVIYGHDLQLKTSFNTSPMYVYGGYPLSVADVDRDGFAEIFIQHIDGYLRCYRPDGSIKWTVSVSGSEEKSSNILIADINGDSIPEVWTRDKIFNAVSGTLLVSLPETFGFSVLYGQNGGKALMPAFADFDNDGILELAGGNKVYKLNITNSTGTAGNSATLWKTISANGIGDGLTSVADIDIDGFMDVVVVRDGCMYAWKPYSGTASTPELIATCPYVSSAPGSRALLTDVNNDGYPEILFTYIANVTAYQYVPSTQSLQQMWLRSTSDLSGATTMTAFDFNQDGSVEIVYRDQSDLRIIDGVTGNNKSSFACMAPTAVDYPAIVDLDKDGQAEIIASYNTYDNNQDKHAKLVVFHSPANVRWAPARYVWNQHAYNVVNVNNDLTIPAYNFNPATAFTDPDGVVLRPFNNFLQQATTLDQYGRPFMPLANASATNDTSVTHENGVVSLNFTFCNTGGEPLTPPFYLIYYANSYGETYLGQTVFTGEWPPLLPGECMTVHRNFTEDELGIVEDLQTIVAVINADMMGVAQYGGSQLQFECDTSDNYFYFNVDFCDIPQDTVIADICVRESYSDENFDIPATETQVAGTFYFSRVFQVDDCDSVIVLELRVHPVYDLHFTETIPEGTAYDNHGIFLNESLLESGDRIDTSITYQSEYGCDSVIHVSIQVVVADIAIYLPNAITPSKSDGLNDVFSLPEKIQNQIADFEIVIFNRWGEMVFYSTDKGFQWNGEYKGKTFYDNVYQYVIHYSNPFGKMFTKKGTITVL